MHILIGKLTINVPLFQKPKIRKNDSKTVTIILSFQVKKPPGKGVFV